MADEWNKIELRLTVIDGTLSAHTEMLKQIAEGMRTLLDELHSQRIAKLEARVEALERDRIEQAFPDA